MNSLPGAVVALLLAAAPPTAQKAPQAAQIGAEGDMARQAGVAVTATPSISSAEAARRAGVLTPPPSHVAIKALFEGGTWSMDIAHGGGWMSGFKTAKEYGDLNFTPPNIVPLKPGPMEVYRNIRRENGRGRQIFGPYAQCHPAGMPYILTIDFSGGSEWVVADDQILVMYGAERETRRIYLDGRPHPDEHATTPLYNGFSVAHWEGKTFVVETTNIRGSNTQIEPHVPKPEGSYIVERFTPTAPNRMLLEMTMWNPEFTKPWVVKSTMTKKPGGTLIESMCSDDNRYVFRNGELTLTTQDGKVLEKAED